MRIGWSPRQIRNTRSSRSTATPATSRCSQPFGSCSQPSTTSYVSPLVGAMADPPVTAWYAQATSNAVTSQAGPALDGGPNFVYKGWRFRNSLTQGEDNGSGSDPDGRQALRHRPVVEGLHGPDGRHPRPDRVQLREVQAHRRRAEVLQRRERRQVRDHDR